ncbi:hypothetical protein AC578_4052 [Pseudocercospora eumusae]|uniref:Uncharacterized protein n=1 Tax=Pseudocercospora eumusae TaxID=321146 RepID=A0A139GX77_9PEZI|nr:hypothetical protein AC578_4052 [Pseudocercospora eumusae]
MHSFAVTVFLALCATQCLAAPKVEVALLRPDGDTKLGQLLDKRSPVVVETDSTGDAATDAKVADELKKVGPALQAEGDQLAPLVEAEESALPKLMDDLQAVMVPLLEMANMMQVEADTVANAEAAAQKATTANTATTGATTPKTTRRQARALQLAARNPAPEPWISALLPIAASIISDITKREAEAEAEAGFGSLLPIAATIISDIITKREAEAKAEAGFGSIAASIFDDIDLTKREAEAEAEAGLGALAPILARGVGQIIGMISKREAELQVGLEKRKGISSETIKDIAGAGQIVVNWLGRNKDKLNGQ